MFNKVSPFLIETIQRWHWT